MKSSVLNILDYLYVIQEETWVGTWVFMTAAQKRNLGSKQTVSIISVHLIHKT